MTADGKRDKSCVILLFLVVTIEEILVMQIKVPSEYYDFKWNVAV